MANTTPFRMNPQLGPNLHQVVLNDRVWYDGPGRGAAGVNQIASPQLGDTAFGSDGREYMWVEASGAIVTTTAPGRQVALTVTGLDNITAATGSGGWYAPPTSVYGVDLAAGDRFWAAKGTAP